MMKRMIEIGNSVNEVLRNNNKHKHLFLNNTELEFLKVLCDIFEPFFKITNKLSFEKYPSCNIVIYSIFSFKKKYEPKPNDNKTISLIKSIVLESLNHYVETYKLLENKTLVLSTFLTPNRKRFAIVENLTQKQRFTDMSIQVLTDLVRSSNFKLPTENENEPTRLDDSLDDNTYLPRPAEEGEVINSLMNQIEAYMMDNTNEKNSLLYWKSHKADMPYLSEASTHILAVPGSTTPSERLFSSAKNQVFDRRNKISPENVEALMFLSENEPSFEWDWEENDTDSAKE